MMRVMVKESFYCAAMVFLATLPSWSMEKSPNELYKIANKELNAKIIEYKNSNKVYKEDFYNLITVFQKVEYLYLDAYYDDDQLFEDIPLTLNDDSLINSFKKILHELLQYTSSSRTYPVTILCADTAKRFITQHMPKMILKEEEIIEIENNINTYINHIYNKNKQYNELFNTFFSIHNDIKTSSHNNAVSHFVKPRRQETIFDNAVENGYGAYCMFNDVAGNDRMYAGKGFDQMVSDATYIPETKTTTWIKRSKASASYQSPKLNYFKDIVKQKDYDFFLEAFYSHESLTSSDIDQLIDYITMLMRTDKSREYDKMLIALEKIDK